MFICPRCGHAKAHSRAYCVACLRDYADGYVTSDSNGTPYHTFCWQPVTAHRGNTPHRLGVCPTPAED